MVLYYTFYIRYNFESIYVENRRKQQIKKIRLLPKTYMKFNL